MSTNVFGVLLTNVGFCGLLLQSYVCKSAPPQWCDWSLGVYLEKGRNYFYFSEMSKYYIYWKKRQNYFLSTRFTLVV